VLTSTARKLIVRGCEVRLTTRNMPPTVLPALVSKTKNDLKPTAETA